MDSPSLNNSFILEDTQSSNLEETIANSSIIEENIVISSNIEENKYKDSKYNKSNYTLPVIEAERIYIFKNKLFTRSLLPINYNKEREIKVVCTLCSYNKIVKLSGFQSSNFTIHYRKNHSTIAYNEESENRLKLIKIEDISNKSSFFNNSLNLSDSKKRARTNTINEFSEDEALFKILNFIIDNNLSFNILNKDSFKELLNYYNKASPIINSSKIRALLKDTYNNSLI